MEEIWVSERLFFDLGIEKKKYRVKKHKNKKSMEYAVYNVNEIYLVVL